MPLKQNRTWKFFASIKLTIWLLAIITLFSAIGTLIPQNEEAAFYIDKYGHFGYTALSKTGLNNMYGSWWFILSLVLFSLNLLVCLLNRFSLKRLSLGSTLSHLSVLIILLGTLIGMTQGHKGFIKISEGEEVSSFTNQRKEQVDLGFVIRLNDFIYKEHIDPKEGILVYPAGKKGDFCSIHGASEEAKNQGLIARIPAEIGAESEISETGYKLKVLCYLPDFVMDTATKVASSRSSLPNNPAINVELKDKSGAVNTFWIFANFPDIHQNPDAHFRFVYNWVERRPKDFISKVTIIKGGKEIIARDIRVNEPLNFGGYTFFQSTYDTGEFKWSGLQVVNDPGVPVVYTGFILLIAGLMIIFYINPLLKSLPAGRQGDN
jgi:ResB-like family